MAPLRGQVPQANKLALEEESDFDAQKSWS